ncbi:GNAT family N-acetyltransferase [soil metagenome]
MTPSLPHFAIRDAHPDDLETIVAFNASLAEETEGQGLDLRTLRLGVRAALAKPDRLRYWVAERDSQLLGQAAVTREWSDWRNGWLWWFQSVYVRPEARGLGVFRALHDHIRHLAQAKPNVVGLRLYVEAENEKAQRIYQALGFVPAGYQVFEEIWSRPIDRPSV